MLAWALFGQLELPGFGYPGANRQDIMVLVFSYRQLSGGSYMAGR